MRYRLRIGDETAEVEASAEDMEKGRVRFTMGRGEFRVSYKALSGNGYLLSVNGEARKAFVCRGERGKYVSVEGRSFLVQDADQWLRPREMRGGPEEPPGEITPPMPSVVVRILVQEGDLVRKGEGLVVVTAMKMETTLPAPRGGKVRKIHTCKGAKVAPGDILVELEEEAAEDE